MYAKMTQSLDLHAKALVLRAERQRVIASNIANADTPGYVARDVDFKAALAQAIGSGNTPAPTLPTSQTGQTATHPRHIDLALSSSELGGNRLAYAPQTQPSMDGNSVDLDRERSNFVDNAIRYESTLRFINGSAKTILSAIQGQ